MTTLPRWYVRRPHATDRFRERADLGVIADRDVENILRNALDLAWSRKDDDRENRLTHGRAPGEQLLRLYVEPSKKVVYAVLQAAPHYDNYDFIIPTVLTQEQFEMTNREGTISTLGAADTAGALAAVREQLKGPKYKEMVVLMWKTIDDKQHTGTYCVDDVAPQVNQLLDQGVPRANIRLYKEIPFRISVEIGDTATSEVS